MNNLSDFLSSESGKKELTDAFDMLLRKRKFSRLHDFLTMLLGLHQSNLTRVAKEALSASVYIAPKDWKRIHWGINTHSGNSNSVAAIGFDLTGHWNWHYGTPGPGLELSYYKDEVDLGFRFSENSQEQILDAAQYPCPWQGCFTECEPFAPVYGLDDLNKALWAEKKRSSTHKTLAEEEQVEHDHVGFFLGVFTLHLRFQETLFRELNEYGLPRKMPVVVGTHDFVGRYNGYNVFFCETVSDLGETYGNIQKSA